MYENKFMAPYFFFSSKSEICQKHDDIITQIMTGIILISLKIETMIAQLPVRYQCWDKYIGKILIFSSKDTLFLSLNSAFNPVFPSEKRELLLRVLAFYDHLGTKSTLWWNSTFVLT